MLKTNIPGSILICLILFGFISTGIYLGITLDWPAYFKYLGVVAVIAFIISAIVNTTPSGKESK